MPVTAKALCSLVCLLVFLLPAPLLAETLSIPGTGDGPAALRTLGAAFSMQNPRIKIEVRRTPLKMAASKALEEDSKLLASVTPCWLGLLERSRSGNICMA